LPFNILGHVLDRSEVAENLLDETVDELRLSPQVLCQAGY
jgi:hypothetical protein